MSVQLSTKVAYGTPAQLDTVHPSQRTRYAVWSPGHRNPFHSFAFASTCPRKASSPHTPPRTAVRVRPPHLPCDGYHTTGYHTCLMRVTLQNTCPAAMVSGMADGAVLTSATSTDIPYGNPHGPCLRTGRATARDPWQRMSVVRHALGDDRRCPALPCQNGTTLKAKISANSRSLAYPLCRTARAWPPGGTRPRCHPGPPSYCNTCPAMTPDHSELSHLTAPAT